MSQTLCRYCDEPIEMSQARHDSGLADACFGCAGYPFCSCDKSHNGDCPIPSPSEAHTPTDEPEETPKENG